MAVAWRTPVVASTAAPERMLHAHRSLANASAAEGRDEEDAPAKPTPSWLADFASVGLKAAGEDHRSGLVSAGQEHGSALQSAAGRVESGMVKSALVLAGAAVLVALIFKHT